MTEDERVQLVALAWLGRGTYDLSEWRTALDTARSEHRKRTAEYLLGLPLLGDYLEDGLAHVRRRHRGQFRYDAKAWTTKTNRWATYRRH